MNEKDTNKKDAPYDLMQDTQYLLLGLDESESESYSLEDILAEFGSEEHLIPEKKDAVPKQDTPQISGREAEDGPAADPQAHPKVIAFPGGPVVSDESNPEDTLVLIDMREYEDEEPSPEELFGMADACPNEQPPPPRQEPVESEQPAAPKPLTMEDIVASTVDAVKAEQEHAFDRQRRRLEKARKKKEKRQQRSRKELPLLQTDQEQSPREAAVFHKRRWHECRRALVLSVPALVLMWLPWILEQAGVMIPYISDDARNAAICVLVAQALLFVLGFVIFRAAVEELKERLCTAYTYTAITNLVALLDAIAYLVLPERTAPAPLGGVACVAFVFSLWGLTGFHRGMWETFRTAAMGEPSCVADRCEAGIAKGLGRREGFVVRANMESTASHWQRLFLPALTIASAVFALLSSVGQGNGQNFLWCWSAILCASCSLVCPITYCVPLGRVAHRLSHNGTAVAGQYGAATLAAGAQIVVTDTDLFPRGSVVLNGIKLYGEERTHAISYTATLAIQGGGCMGRIFEEICQQEHILCQPVEHFHVHDDNGLSGMIRGETVLVGTPVFMRHQAVRLPATLPAKTALCLAVDGELLAVFAVKYTAAPQVETALRALGRNGLQLVLATRDGNVTPKLLRRLFGAGGKAALPETGDRLALSDPRREVSAPNGLIYRDGLLPFVEMVSLSRRLCQIVWVGNLLAILGSIFGTLLGFYLTFVGRSAILSPIMLLIYLLLWTLPMIPLIVSVDKM